MIKANSFWLDSTNFKSELSPARIGDKASFSSETIIKIVSTSFDLVVEGKLKVVAASESECYNPQRSISVSPVVPCQQLCEN